MLIIMEAKEEIIIIFQTQVRQNQPAYFIEVETIEIYFSHHSYSIKVETNPSYYLWVTMEGIDQVQIKD